MIYRCLWSLYFDPFCYHNTFNVFNQIHQNPNRSSVKGFINLIHRFIRFDSRGIVQYLLFRGIDMSDSGASNVQITAHRLLYELVCVCVCVCEFVIRAEERDHSLWQ